MSASRPSERPAVQRAVTTRRQRRVEAFADAFGCTPEEADPQATQSDTPMPPSRALARTYVRLGDFGDQYQLAALDALTALGRAMRAPSGR